MNRKTFLIFPMAVFCIMFAFLAVILLNNSSQKQNSAREKKHLTETLELIAGRDITIYWAGDFPEELSPLKDKTVLLTPGKITEDKMPVKSTNISFTEYNQAGEIVSSTEPRTYTKDLLIVIDQTEDLTPSDIEVIRQCLALNNVPAVIVGKKPVVEIREAMYIITGTFDDYDSVFYSFNKGFEEHVIDKAVVKQGGIPYYQALADIITGYCQARDKAEEEQAQASTEPLTTTSAATTESTTTESSSETTDESSGTGDSESTAATTTTKEKDGMDLLRGATSKNGD